jgi:CRP-like cAMP-binding protein
MRDIVAHAKDEPAIYGMVALIGCWQHRAALALIGMILAKPSNVRLVEMILGMLPPSHGGARSATLSMSQEVLAGRIGVSRQQLNTLLGGLKRRGFIDTSYGQIHVFDRAALASLATTKDP